MKNFKVIGTLDPQPLLARATRNPELWQQGPRERYEGSAHSQANSILVRWVEQDQETKFFSADGGAVRPLTMVPEPMAQSFIGRDGNRITVGKLNALTLDAVLGSTKSVDYPAGAQLMPDIGEAVMSVLEPLGAIGELGHVMLTRLPAGGAIAKHMDEGVYADLYDRFHVCLQGDAGNTFECGGEAFHPAPGEIFWFNHKRPHLVRNEGELERIHLIVDVMAPAFTALRGIYYQAERITDLWAELELLLEAHYQEVAHYPDIPLDPDKEAYAALQAIGQLRCYTARDSGRLIGYVFFFVRPSFHYRGSLQAHQDVLFLHPDYRHGLTGATLIRVAETRLRAEGVQVVYHHAKRTNRVGELLERLGYDLVDEIRAKRLDKGGKKKWPHQPS